MDDHDIPITTHDLYRSLLVDALNGTVTCLSGSDERAILHADGSHTHLKTDVRIVTRDGRVIDPSRGEVAYRCTLCHEGPYSRHVVVVCGACQHLVCTACAVQAGDGTFCAACHRARHWTTLRAFFASIR